MSFVIGCQSSSEGGIELPSDDEDDDSQQEAEEEVEAEAGAEEELPDAAPAETDEEASTDDDDVAAPADEEDIDPEPPIVEAGLGEPETTEDASIDVGQLLPPLDAGLATDDLVDDIGYFAPDAGWPEGDICTYYSDPVPFPPLVDAGPDAGPPPAPHVTLQSNNFVGSYLGDNQGLALYIYTADTPGDCNNQPVSTCVEDCLQSWPLFEAGDRVLAEGLDESAFGTFVRSDGAQQTTYFGWPLYYFKNDFEAGDTEGQGRGKVWYLAETLLPNLMIMRAPEELEGVRYLADGRGYTLYAYEGDQVGTEELPPKPACIGQCRAEFQPFSVRSLRPVTLIEPDELSVFVRTDGGEPQVSFRGQPLYLAKDDTRAGEVNGLLHEGFSLVEF